jgi:hypothetical protein
MISAGVSLGAPIPAPHLVASREVAAADRPIMARTKRNHQSPPRSSGRRASIGSLNVGDVTREVDTAHDRDRIGRLFPRTFRCRDRATRVAECVLLRRDRGSAQERRACRPACGSSISAAHWRRWSSRRHCCRTRRAGRRRLLPTRSAEDFHLLSRVHAWHTKVVAALALPSATKALDPDPSPCHSLRHAVYAALSHIGLETAQG